MPDPADSSRLSRTARFRGPGLRVLGLSAVGVVLFLTGGLRALEVAFVLAGTAEVAFSLVGGSRRRLAARRRRAERPYFAEAADDTAGSAP